jgi:CBS domain containing-hemolysin-like protein
LFVLSAALALLLTCSDSSFSSETALVSISRFRLLHRARNGHRGAKLAQRGHCACAGHCAVSRRLSGLAAVVLR